jgi:hypothetical protein
MSTEWQLKNKRDVEAASKASEQKYVEKQKKQKEDAGNAFKETMSEGKIDTMGNTTGMKKGGKVAGKLATRGYGMCGGGMTKGKKK